MPNISKHLNIQPHRLW